MIQLNFRARDATAALEKEPVEVGYSSHEGAERADWGDDKLELVGGTHPVVYPAAGSHANKFTDALYLGSSAEAGVGCDDTLGPHRALRPVVKTIPSDTAAARREFPWIDFEGRWGELQKAFFNGPTGPNLKSQWTEPITWSEGWRTRSYAVPTAGILGTDATDFFCSAVETGSRGLIQLLSNPALTLLLLGAILALAVYLATRTRWRPVAPLRVARRRAWGQILAAAGRMYVKRVLLFLGIGVLFIPLALSISLVQTLVIGGFGLVGVDTSGESAGALALLVVALGTTLTLLGLGLVQAATACALVQIDADRPIGPIQAYRIALGKTRALLRQPWSRRRGVGRANCDRNPGFRWRSGSPSAGPSLPRSSSSRVARPSTPFTEAAELVRRRWLRVASLVAVGSGTGARRRSVSRRPPHSRDGCAATAAERRRGSRVRDRDAVRRARDLVRLLRRSYAARARAGRRPGRAPGGDSALRLSLRVERRNRAGSDDLRAEQHRDDTPVDDEQEPEQRAE